MSGHLSKGSGAQLGRATAFAVAAVLPIYYALRGGSYDIVARQEEAIVVWLVVGLGFALGFFPRARLPRGIWVPLAGIALLAIWTAISLSWTQSDERTLEELARALHLGGLLLLAWGLIDRSHWRAAAAGLVFAAALISALAVASRLVPDAFPANDVQRVLKTDRLNYPFNYWNALGAWSVMAVAMVLAWSAHARHLLTRVVCAAAIPVCGTAIYLTYSRAGAAGSVIAVLLVLILSRNRWVAAVHALAAAGGTALVIVAIRGEDAIANATGDAGAGAVALKLLLAAAIAVVATLLTWFLKGDIRWRLPRVAGRLAAAGAVVLAVLVVVVAGGDEVSKAWDSFQGEKTQEQTTAKPSNDPAARLTSLGGTRSAEYHSAFRAFKDAPAKGIGPGTFEYWWNRDDGREFVRDAHSMYFESAAELGVPGFLFVLTFFIGLAVLVVRARLAAEDSVDAGALTALGAAFLVFLFHNGVDWMWESTAVAAFALISAAVASGALALPGDGWGRLARIGVAVVALFAILVQMPGLASTSKIRDSQEEVRSGDLDTALADANDAVSSQPWAASPFQQRGLVGEANGALRAAEADLLRATQREPNNWRPWLILARIQAKLGQVRPALRSYQTARRLRPDSLFFQAQPPPAQP